MATSFQDNDSYYCNESIESEYDRLRPLLIVSCSSATVSAVVTLIAITAMIICRLVKLLTHRLMLNMLVSILLYSLVLTTQFMGLWHNYWEGKDYSECIAGGFFLEYAGWVTLLSTLMMTVHLTSLVLFPTHYKKVAKLEPFYISFPWIFPLLFSWIPFIHDNYGVSGFGCWIKRYKNCSSNKEGLIELYALWYGELVIGLILNNIGLLIIAITLCKRACKSNEMSLGYRKALKQALPLVIYPITFQILSSFAVANRLYEVIHGQYYIKWLIYAHAVFGPSRGLFAPVLTLIYLLTLRRMIRENVKKWKNICPKMTKRKHVRFQSLKIEEEMATGSRLIDSKDRLTVYRTATVTSPTEYNCRESEVERQYEALN